MVLQIIQLISVESMLVKMLVSNILKKKMEEFPQHVTSVLNVRGAYITFIDPDDWVESDYLEVLYRALIDEKADIAISTYKQFNMDDNCYYMHV